MRQRRKLLFALCSLVTAVMFLFPTSAMAQDLSIKGKVTDKTGEPVIGASVLVQGTANGAVTDIDGEFVLSNVPSNATLRVSFVGYKTENVAVNGKQSLIIVLSDDSEVLDEVVVVG